jgi:hypothetical protein
MGVGVKPVANTASTTQDSTSAVTPVVNAVVPPVGGGILDVLSGIVPLSFFGSTTSPENAASGAQKSVSPSELDKIREEMRALSKSQEEMSKVLDEQDKEARKAIERIKKGQ